MCFISSKDVLSQKEKLLHSITLSCTQFKVFSVASKIKLYSRMIPPVPVTVITSEWQASGAVYLA